MKESLPERKEKNAATIAKQTRIEFRWVCFWIAVMAVCLLLLLLGNNLSFHGVGWLFPVPSFLLRRSYRLMNFWRKLYVLINLSNTDNELDEVRKMMEEKDMDRVFTTNKLRELLEAIFPSRKAKDSPNVKAE